jgi:hypothetical protein
MSLADLKNLLIPQIAVYCKAPIIGADQTGDKPSGAYATFKITSPYIKGIGQNNESISQSTNGYQLTEVDNYKMVISFNAYDLDEDVSLDLAQKLYDWFAFHGADFLNKNNLVIKEQTGITNRDSIILDNYERRNGFDVTLGTTRELVKNIDIVEDVSINQ